MNPTNTRKLAKALNKIKKQHAKTAGRAPISLCPACYEAKRQLYAKLAVKYSMKDVTHVPK